MTISHSARAVRYTAHGACRAVAMVTVLLGLSACRPDSNRDGPTFGNSGLPKNCRAIITANIEGWRERRFTAEEALGSIDRNCGRNGYSWDM